jgi:hypothetical protein
LSIKEVYQWCKEIHARLPLSKWQALGLAVLSLGVVLSERSTLSKMAEKLGMMGKADSVERRAQRWLSNPRIVLRKCCQAWARWVISSVAAGERVILLVDLTKLGGWLDVMMVGVAYRKRCIPLAWRCMTGQHKWDEAQVAIIDELLSWVAPAVPPGIVPLVEADRGIGNSSQLAGMVAGRGWHFLFRVADAVRVRLADGREKRLAEMVKRGQRWSASAQVFKKGGWSAVYVHLIWRRSMNDPWCLITNAPDARGSWYATRMWQDEGFRDLKGGGWQWHRSQVRLADHAERLILALALAYVWTLSLGTRAIRAGKTTLRHITRGHRHTYSVFRLGLRYFHHRVRSQLPIPMRLYLCHALPFP